MTHEQDAEHERDRLRSSYEPEKRSTPGRASASAALVGPSVPEVSGILYRSTDRDASGVAAGADDHVARAASTSGSPLPDDLRESFESSLGSDLSGVRVHTGEESATASQAVGAKAYAEGQDIHFAAGQYDPASRDGQLLLAHEVAHTVQQADQSPTRQHKLEVSTPGDAAEIEADQAAEAMLARKPFSLGQSARGASRMIHRKPSGGASLSTGGGLTFKFGLPLAKANLGYVTLANPGVSVSLKPTSDTEVKTRPSDETKVDAGLAGGGDPAEVKHGKGKTSGGDKFDHAKIEASVKKKWGNVAFTDAMAEVGTSGGSVAITAGGEWKNLVLDVKFAILSFGEKGKDIKFLTATATGTVRGTIEVDGVHFAVTAKLSVDVKPNSKAIAKYLIKKGIIKSLRGFGEILGSIGAVPFLFVEGGYETLKAAYKNIAAGKDIARFVDSANKLSLEVGSNFVAGVLGGNKGMGSSSGKVWFGKAYEISKADNPDMTEDAFRQALIESASWQESARIALARQVRGVLYSSFVESKKDDIHAKDMKHVKKMLFGDDGPPDPNGGFGVPVPQVEKLKDPNQVDFSDDHSAPNKVPAAIREEAKHRVSAGQLTGTIPFSGTNYEFQYDKGAILIHGGEKSEVVPFSR